MGWQYIESLESFNQTKDSFSLPKRRDYLGDDHNVQSVKDKETFAGKPAWAYVSDDFRVIIPYQKNFFESWVAVETQEDIKFHCLSTEDTGYRKLKADENNPLIPIYNIYGIHAFFTRKKGDEGLYSLMMPDDIFCFCNICVDILSIESEKSGLPGDFKDVNFPYSSEMLLSHFSQEISSIRSNL